jgi:hypothetical protein
VDYHALVKRLSVPTGWAAPTELDFEDIRASALTREHLHDDVRGINASLDLIRRTRGGPWPTEPVSAEFDYVDLVWHECEFRERDSSATPCTTPGEHISAAATCIRWAGARRSPNNCSRSMWT